MNSMMEKLIKIKGVGKFKDFNAVGSIAFRKFNIVYGENGCGKTTLTSILRSFKDNDPSMIIQRETQKFTEEQIVRVKEYGKIYEFSGGTWKANQTHEDIEIFDIYFVNENIYSGFDFSADHKKKLHKFVIGGKGAMLADDIDKIKKQIENENDFLKEIEKDIKIKSKTDIGDFDGFLELKEDKDIEGKISKKEKELEISKQNKEIKEKDYLKKLNNISFPINLEELKSNLAKSIESISEEYLELFQKHISHLESYQFENAEDWINKGFKAVKSKCETENLKLDETSCPFCDQPLENAKEMISSYNQYFNQEYSQLKQDISDYSANINNFNLDLELSDIEKGLSINKVLIEFWEKSVKIELDGFDYPNLKEQIIDCFLNIEKVVEEKLQNPIVAVQDDVVIGFEKKYNELNEKISAYNSKIEEINKKIKDVKENIRNEGEIKNELKSLKLIRKRFESDVATLCNSYKEKVKLIKSLRDKNANKQKELKNFSEKIFKRYGPKINEYLTDFSTPFRITNAKSAYKGIGREPFAEYVLTLNGEELSFDDSCKPSIKHSLSEGDKGSIAFAFFLAKLDLDTDISNKIIIFDDPISSFDKNRREKTIKKIIEKNSIAKQIIVLSHNENFIFDLYDKVSNTKALKIDNCGNIKEYSNIEQEMEMPYFKSLREIEDFISEPDDSKKYRLKGDIRLVLEDSLKIRYYKYLNQRYTKTDGSEIGPLTNKDGLGKRIDILECSNCVFKDKNKDKVIEKLRELNVFSSPEHHGNIDKIHRKEKIATPELITYLKDTLDLIYHKI